MPVSSPPATTDQRSFIFTVTFECSWESRPSSGDDSSDITSWNNVDIVFLEISRSPAFVWPANLDTFSLLLELPSKRLRQVQEQDFGSQSALQFFIDCLSAAYRDVEHRSVARLVVPHSSGYIARSDILPQRLLGCTLTEGVVSFVRPRQYFAGTPASFESLIDSFPAAIGGVLVARKKTELRNGPIAAKENESIALDIVLSQLDAELRDRLSFPWLSALPIPERRPTLALIEGGLFGPEAGGTGGSIYTAAEALGIDMVVFDNPGHWVTAPKYRHWYKAFIPLSCPLHPDDGFASNIANAVRSYKGHLDGILTFRDHYKALVAEAAVRLSLPTSPPSAYAIATDKFKTSISEGRNSYRASSTEEAVRVVQQNNVAFPLIIKPTNGFLSEGVSRVENIEQLKAAAQAVDVANRHGTEFVIEKYCDGPEVDVNVVLCDGEVRLFEVSDDFPKGGDVNGDGKVKSFIELANVLPSALPAMELAILEESLRQSLIRMGFLDGFFHLEARVENSRMEYAVQNEVLDLRERDGIWNDSEEPSSWLIEVNPRPPGIQASEAVRHTYGVDYFGLALLFALNDKHRAKQLSHTFTRGPQYWCEMVFIPVEKGGMFDSDDVCEELFTRRPDLKENVSGSFCFLKKGAYLADPSKTGVNSWVAYFNIYSRESRQRVLELADIVRNEVRISVI
jgi:hypothetical protein